MIICRIELHRAGKAAETITLGTLIISKVKCYDDGRKADYHVRVMGKGKDEVDLAYGAKPIREDVVIGHARKSRPVFDLVLKALVAAGYRA